MFKQVIELNPNDYDAHFEIAAMFEQTDQELALTHYAKGVEIMRSYIREPEKDKYVLPWQSSYSDRSQHAEFA